MPKLTVAALLNAGRLERVPGDRDAALSRISKADTHLTTAAALITVDNDMAYTALYDAARKAVAAHMLAHGFRVPARMGAHKAVGIYAEETIPDSTGSVADFQRMRRQRNKKRVRRPRAWPPRRRSRPAPRDQYCGRRQSRPRSLIRADIDRSRTVNARWTTRECVLL